MQAEQVPMVDLHGLIKPKLAELQTPDNVHFKEPGYQLLGDEVAKAVLAVKGRSTTVPATQPSGK